MYAGNYRYGEEAGSAKWGTLKEGVAFKDQSDPSNNLLFTKNYGLALKKPKFDLEHDRNLNVMVIGGSGSGKTRNYVKPNLMQLNASYFLTDPKGTSLPECGYLFRDNGYRIKVFNTIEFNKSMHYNPLKYVKTDADILSFVNCLISNTNGDNTCSTAMHFADIGKTFNLKTLARNSSTSISDVEFFRNQGTQKRTSRASAESKTQSARATGKDNIIQFAPRQNGKDIPSSKGTSLASKSQKYVAMANALNAASKSYVYRNEVAR